MSKITFCKHYVKRNPANLKFMVDEKGNPVVGDFIRETRITNEVAEQLNNSWENSGVIWVEKNLEPTPEEIKAALWEKIDAKIESGEIKKEDRPHHASGVDKLKQILGEE